MWATRAPSGRPGSAPATPAARWSCAWKTSTPNAATAFAEAAYEDLRWLGIRWQEGPDNGGPFAPYEQSRRRSIYLAAWRNLLRRGFLYPCNCSRKDLETALGAPHEESHPPPKAPWVAANGIPTTTSPSIPAPVAVCSSSGTQLPGPTASDIDQPEGINWRFRVPDGEAIEFDDRNLGRQRFVAGVDFGDFVVWRRDGVPSYQLACVADDAAMGITEVVRGADLLKSTARQILLNRALATAIPPGSTAAWWSTTTAAAWPSATTRSASAPSASAVSPP